MRRLALASTLLLAACATQRQQPATENVPTPPPAATTAEPRQLLGLTAPELVGHFGSPALQIREGNSLKLQFRERRCVLDAYLYPSSGGQYRVTHVDTRSRTGVDTDQATCISELENPS